jgi:hypothetical protein
VGNACSRRMASYQLPPELWCYIVEVAGQRVSEVPGLRLVSHLFLATINRLDKGCFMLQLGEQEHGKIHASLCDTGLHFLYYAPSGLKSYLLWRMLSAPKPWFALRCACALPAAEIDREYAQFACNYGYKSVDQLRRRIGAFPYDRLGLACQCPGPVCHRCIYHCHGDENERTWNACGVCFGQLRKDPVCGVVDITLVVYGATPPEQCANEERVFETPPLRPEDDESTEPPQYDHMCWMLDDTALERN